MQLFNHPQTRPQRKEKLETAQHTNIITDVFYVESILILAFFHKLSSNVIR